MSNELVPTQSKELIDLTSLTEQEQARAREIADTIDVNSSQVIIEYGTGAQSNISSFADTVLKQVRSSDSGHVGSILTDLVVKIKDLDIDSLGKQSPLARIPIIGNLLNKAKKFIVQYEKVAGQIEEMVGDLDKARMELIKDITLLDTLHEQNKGYLKDLDIFIAAGVMKLDELRETVYPELELKAQSSNDPVDAQVFQDFGQLLNRFEKKLHDLKLSRMVAVQTQPQVRLIQNNNQLLVEKIQSSILNTIPLWKNQIIIAISLFRQKKALELQKSVTDATNDLLAQNAALLKDSSIEVAQQSERGIVDIETLKQVNDDLITTIEETLKIQAEGRQKRAEAETELVKLEGELKEKLISAK